MNKFPCERKHLITRSSLDHYVKVTIELCCTMHGKVGESSMTDWCYFNDKTVQKEASGYLDKLWSDHVSDINLRGKPVYESLPVHLL